MISDQFNPADFLRAVAHWDLLRLQSTTEEELRAVDLICRRAWNDGRSVPATAPRYLNFLRRLSAWFDAGGVTRVRLSPDLRDAWSGLVVRLVENGQLPPAALRSLGRTRAAAHRGPLERASHARPDVPSRFSPVPGAL